MMAPTNPASASAATAVEPPAAVAVPAEPTAEIAAAASYTVQPGDTLLGIAMKFDVPMAAVQLRNNLGEATTVRLDQVLEIPASQAWPDASPFWILHEVTSGETFGEIAAAYGLALGDLQAANASLTRISSAVGQDSSSPSAIRLICSRRPVVASDDVAPAPEPTATLAAVAQAEPESLLAADSVAVTEGDAEADPPAVEERRCELRPTHYRQKRRSRPIRRSRSAPDLAALPGEIFRLLNEQRAAYGLPALLWNDTLASAAQRHADDCEAQGWCGHTGSDGSSYRDRIIREGYDPVRWSECWAWYGSAERAVAMWMDEAPPNDPHRRTILSDYLTEVGVGVVPGNGFGYYFIADFGTPNN